MVGSDSPTTASYPGLTSTSFPGLHQAFPCSFSYSWPHPFLWNNNTTGCILNQKSVGQSASQTQLVIFTPSFVPAGPLKALVITQFMSSGNISPHFISSPGSSSSLSQFAVSPPSPTALCVYQSPSTAWLML